MADTLDTTQKAIILLADDSPLLNPAYFIATDDTSVAIPADGGASRHAVAAVGVGSCVITATRAADGATATMTVTVTEAGGFAIHLGTPTPK